VASVVRLLEEKRLITPPRWLSSNIVYETIMGSQSYGVSSGGSDIDVYGVCIPLKGILFPHLEGVIPGFGNQGQKFQEFEHHHVKDKDSQKEYDLKVMNIVKFFELARQGNANIIDSIFTHQSCVLYCNQVGQIIRDNRKLFLSKQCYKCCRGYAYGQMSEINKSKNIKEIKGILAFEDKYGISHKTTFADSTCALMDKTPDKAEGIQFYVGPLSDLPYSVLKEYNDMYSLGIQGSKRFENRKIDGTDLKFLYHLIRLLDEAVQILSTHDLDLQQNREQLKSIRRGEWTEAEVFEHFNMKERELETIYANSTLREKPDEDRLKRVLFECLETHYGSLDKAVVFQDEATVALREIEEIIDKLKRKQVLHSENQLQNREHQPKEAVPGCNLTGSGGEI